MMNSRALLSSSTTPVSSSNRVTCRPRNQPCVRPISFKSRTSCSDAPEGVQAPAFETVDAAVSQGQHEVLAVPQPVASDVNQPGMLVCCERVISGFTNIMQLCHVCCCSGSAFHPLTLHACGWFSSTRLCVSNFLQASTLVDQLPSPASLWTTEIMCFKLLQHI